MRQVSHRDATRIPLSISTWNFVVTVRPTVPRTSSLVTAQRLPCRVESAGRAASLAWGRRGRHHRPGLTARLRVPGQTRRGGCAQAVVWGTRSCHNVPLRSSDHVTRAR
jgi:hypothetical protein